MKKILFAIASAFVALTATASNVEKIQFANKGDMALGIMVGMPAYDGANMPQVSLDAMWGLKDGFCNTKTFGQNGAIDLGVYVGFCQYGDTWEEAGVKYKHSYWELPLAVRCGFNWEFVKKLDVYAGFQGGCAIEHWMDKVKVNGENERTSGNHCDGIFGMYCGAKWMFTDVFGVKLEWSGDWVGDGNDMSPIAGGVTFNF